VVPQKPVKIKRWKSKQLQMGMFYHSFFSEYMHSQTLPHHYFYFITALTVFGYSEGMLSAKFISVSEEASKTIFLWV